MMHQHIETKTKSLSFCSNSEEFQWTQEELIWGHQTGIPMNKLIKGLTLKYPLLANNQEILKFSARKPLF